MARLGADTEQLHDLARALRGAADRLERSLATLESARRATSWRGPDAERFAQDWAARHAHDARRLSERWRSAADGLARHGGEQEQASSADAVSTAPGVADSRPGSDRSPTRGEHVLRPAAPARAPRVEQQFLAGTVLTAAGATFALDHVVVVRSVEGPRSHIELRDRRAAGASATVGAEVRVGADGQALLGGSAAASASLGEIERRTYDVDDDQVWPTVARIEAEAALGRAAASTRSLPGAGLAVAALPAAVAIWDEVADLLPGPDLDVADWVRSLGVAPEPQRVESLTEVTLQASIGASLASQLGLSGSGELTGTLRHGTVEVDGRPSTRVIEAEGRLATALRSVWTDRLGVEEPVGAQTAAVRLELPIDGGGSSAPLATLTWTSTTADVATRRSVAIDLAGATERLDDALGHAVARLTGALASPAPSADAVHAALDELAHLDLSGVTSPATTDQLELTRRGTGGSAQVGAGVSIGLSGDGGWTTVTRLER